MELIVRCPCGWELRGMEEKVVAAAIAHAKENHNKDITRTEVMTMARPAEGLTF